MSWTQGIQHRDTLPEHFVEWADSQAKEGGKLECIVWDSVAPDTLFMDYYLDGRWVEAIKIRIKDKVTNAD